MNNIQMMKTMLYAGIIAEETSKNCYRFLMKNDANQVKEIKCQSDQNDSDKPVIRISNAESGAEIEFEIKLAALSAIVEREKSDRATEYNQPEQTTQTSTPTQQPTHFEAAEILEALVANGIEEKSSFEFKMY